VRCPTGEARITPAFRLPARFVVHTVGPVWRGGGHGEPGLLASCYRESLALARSAGAASIAFPAIGTGVYGYPPEAAAAVAARECVDFLAGDPSCLRIVLVAFRGSDADVLGAALARAWSCT
jgi:O-acetyl-ADP-ribose deacetylase (regulator of RNase III)